MGRTRDFWRLPAGILIACLLLTIATLLIGHALPTPSTGSALDQNSCSLPCFFGVTPGVTTHDQAVRVITGRIQPTQISDGLISFSLIDADGLVSNAAINFDPNRDVESVRVVPIDLAADVGQLSDLLTEPPNHLFRTCNEVQPVRFLMTFGAQDQLSAELFPSGDLRPTTPITVFTLSSQAASSLYDERSSFGCTVDVGWIGFAPLWKYLSLKPLN